jgi:excisionase family DNA binding protein
MTTKPTVPPDEILTQREVCDLLKISRVSLWKLVKSKQIPVIRLSRRIKRFHRADILSLSKTI